MSLSSRFYFYCWLEMAFFIVYYLALIVGLLMETRIVEDRYICEVRETSRYGNGCIKNRFQTNICRLTPYSLTLNAWNCRILGVFILCASVDCLFRFSINHIRRTLLKKWGVMLNLQFTTKDAKNLIKWSIFL